MPNSLPDTKCFGEIAKYFGENAHYLVNNKGFSPVIDRSMLRPMLRPNYSAEASAEAEAGKI